MANLAGVLNELQQDRAHLVQQVRRLAGCGKTSISTASAKTTRLSSLMVVACYRRILRRIVELRQ